MRSTYKKYTIVTETAINPVGGWSLSLQIFGPDDRPVVSGINLGRDMTFATEFLAHCAGITLARYWVDARE